MAKEIWMVEANMDSINSLEFRVKKAEEVLKANAVRVLIKAGELSSKTEMANWLTVAMASSEKEAHEKSKRLREMTTSERACAISTGKSLYLNL